MRTLIICLWSFATSCKVGTLQEGKHLKSKDLPTIVDSLRHMPREDITLNKKIKSYLDKHKVYISLTTSPTRVSKVVNVLKTLDLQHISEILINLPVTFGRDGSTYDIPEELKNFPKVTINRLANDFGPITKIIPGLDYARQQDDNSIVISVDDDIGYPFGMVSQIIKVLILSQRALVGGSIMNIHSWKLDSNKWPHDMPLVLEGYAAIGYKVADISPKALDDMLAYITAEKNERGTNFCLLSDDIVINYVLAGEGLHPLQINNRYYSIRNIVPFAYGEDTDALHHGAGSTSPVDYPSENDAINAHKYQNCFSFMSE